MVGALFFCNDARGRYGINTHIIVLESSISSLVLLPSRIYSSTGRSLVLKTLTFPPLDAGRCAVSSPLRALSLEECSQALRLFPGALGLLSGRLREKSEILTGSQLAG